MKTIPQKSTMGTLRAVETAFFMCPDTFYLNDLTSYVWMQTVPFKPMSGTVGRKLRILRQQGKLNYNADMFGVYTKSN